MYSVQGAIFGGRKLTPIGGKLRTRQFFKFLPVSKLWLKLQFVDHREPVRNLLGSSSHFSLDTQELNLCLSASLQLTRLQEMPSTQSIMSVLLF